MYVCIYIYIFSFFIVAWGTLLHTMGVIHRRRRPVS
jgi:hypothetical protein